MSLDVHLNDKTDPMGNCWTPIRRSGTSDVSRFDSCGHTIVDKIERYAGAENNMLRIVESRSLPSSDILK
jgi:hypothetical protein